MCKPLTIERINLAQREFESLNYMCSLKIRIETKLIPWWTCQYDMSTTIIVGIEADQFSYFGVETEETHTGSPTYKMLYDAVTRLSSKLELHTISEKPDEE